MSFIYDVSIILFALKIFLFQHGLLVRSLSLKYRYGHSGDKVRENISGYMLHLAVFGLLENCDACFYCYWL